MLCDKYEYGTPMLLSLKWNFFQNVFVSWSVLKGPLFRKKKKPQKPIYCSLGVQWYFHGLCMYMNILLYWSLIDEDFWFWNFIYIRNRKFQSFDWNNNLMTIGWLSILSLIIFVNHIFKDLNNRKIRLRLVNLSSPQQEKLTILNTPVEMSHDYPIIN